jgi:hypothetical protein
MPSGLSYQSQTDGGVATDKRSRKDGDDLASGKRKKVDAEQEEQEQAEQQQTEEPEHAKLQNQVGNEGINAILGITAVRVGQDGTSLDLRDRAEDLERDYGGDDPADPAGGITLDELISSWNPGIKKSADKVAFAEPMPSAELPEPDDELRALVKSEPPRPVPTAWSLDALIQPPLRVFSSATAAWTAEVGRWAGGDLGRRALARAISPGAPLLGDPWGRPLISRTRLASIGTWLLLDAGLGDARPSAASSAFLQLCLDLAAAEPRVRDVWITAQKLGNELPLSVKLLEPELAGNGARVSLRSLPAAARGHLSGVLGVLLDLPAASTYLVPLVDDATPIDDDDPLGLDSMLGAPIDREAGLFDAAIQNAERLAAHSARMRVQVAGTCAAVADACAPWSSGSPDANLLEVAATFDARVAQVLTLLVDVARSAQQRAVVVRGLQNGLRRAAGMIQGATDEAVGRLTEVVGGVLPPDPQIPEFGVEPSNPLSEAWADGTPATALPWLRGLPDDLSHRTALCLTRASAGEAPESLADPLVDLRGAALAEGRPLLAAALGSAAGPALLWAGRFADALALAEALHAHALGRRNGVAAADAVFLGVEAARLSGDEDLARTLLRRGASAMYWGGCGLGFELALRWRPPEDET